MVLGGFNLNTGDHVEHSSVTHTTRGILQGCPGLRRWHGAGGCQATSFVSRRVNLAKLGSRRQNRLLGGPGDNR